MSSRLGWVDFTEGDRQRMLDVVGLFREQDTRDELGIGTIRDAFANYFFPGTSTIQTRARYMLFVPWIYLNLEKRLNSTNKKVTPEEVARLARCDEVYLISALLKSNDTAGLIGKESGDKLQRLPSTIYWTGLASWGIRYFPGSREQYHEYLCSSRSRKMRLILNDDGNPVGGYQGENWDPGIPEPPEDFPQKASFALTRKEASFLQDHIFQHHKDSVLAHMVISDELFDTEFLWKSKLVNDLPCPLQENITDARNFSAIMHGAALLYNLMLAEKVGNPEWVENYETRFSDWADRLSFRMDELRVWYGEQERFWRSESLQQAKIPYRTKSFVKGWLYEVFHTGLIQNLAAKSEARELIRMREVQMKKGRARLENQRALDLWGGSSGDRQLDFRWSTVRIIANDIVQGFQSGGEADA